MQEFVAVIFQRILQVSCKNLVNTIFKIQASIICQDQTGKILTIDFQESCRFNIQANIVKFKLTRFL